MNRYTQLCPQREGSFPGQLRGCPPRSGSWGWEGGAEFTSHPPESQSSLPALGSMPLLQVTSASHSLIHSLVCSFIRSFSTSWGPGPWTKGGIRHDAGPQGAQRKGGAGGLQRGTSATRAALPRALGWNEKDTGSTGGGGRGRGGAFSPEGLGAGLAQEGPPSCAVEGGEEPAGKTRGGGGPPRHGGMRAQAREKVRSGRSFRAFRMGSAGCCVGCRDASAAVGAGPRVQGRASPWSLVVKPQAQI